MTTETTMGLMERASTTIGRSHLTAAALLAAVAVTAPAVFAQTPAAAQAAKLVDLPSFADARKIADTTCASCHGAQGEGMPAAGFPRLAGTGGAYLQSQLDAFASGYRKNSVMQPIAQALSQQQRIELAQFYASLPATVSVDKTAFLEPDPSNLGEWLALRGRWTDDIPPCGHCHGPTGLGAGEHFPPLAGQPASYLRDQLQGWKDGLRPPGPMALMVLIASRLNAADIAAVANFYATLPAKPQPAPRQGGPQ
ncbi:c-type cytochrome [Piscinibacter sakaiensis]|uniref:c-type cytochrome n=1 Tax=Piscinibacter sakaiensis TaxID=1547922 RepID=UPI003AAA5F44